MQRRAWRPKPPGEGRRGLLYIVCRGSTEEGSRGGREVCAWAGNPARRIAVPHTTPQQTERGATPSLPCPPPLICLLRPLASACAAASWPSPPPTCPAKPHCSPPPPRASLRLCVQWQRGLLRLPAVPPGLPRAVRPGPRRAAVQPVQAQLRLRTVHGESGLAHHQSGLWPRLACRQVRPGRPCACPPPLEDAAAAPASNLCVRAYTPPPSAIIPPPLLPQP